MGAVHALCRGYAMKHMSPTQTTMVLNFSATVASSSSMLDLPSSEHWIAVCVAIVGGMSIVIGSNLINEAYARGNVPSVTIISKTYPLLVYGISIFMGGSQFQMKKIMGCAFYGLACYCFLD